MLKNKKIRKNILVSAGFALVLFASAYVLFGGLSTPVNAANPDGCSHRYQTRETNGNEIYPSGTKKSGRMPAGELLTIIQDCNGDDISEYLYVGNFAGVPSYEPGEGRQFLPTADLGLLDQITVPTFMDPAKATYIFRSGVSSQPIQVSGTDTAVQFMERHNIDPSEEDRDSGPINGEDPEGAANTDPGKVTPTCESGGLSWIFCPIVNLSVGGIEFLYNTFIENQLSIDALQTDSALYATWGAFRTIANSLFVVVFLIIIFSQALSLNIDAYTIKKIIPKLVAAAILVQLSFVLSGLLVDIFNLLGGGIRGLINAPARDAGGLLPSGAGGIFRPDSGDAALGLATIVGIGVALQAISLFTLVPIILSGFLSLLIGVFTLIARNILIYFLIVLSPIAAVAWVLPNTEKTARLWGDIFIKLLVMYPIIQGMIGMGELGAHIVGGDGADAGFYEIITSFVMLVTPYFLLPMTFRFAGGAISTLGGMMNDKGRGLIDASRKKAQYERRKKLGGMAAGSRFSERGKTAPIGRLLNRATSQVAAGSANFRGKDAIKAAVEANRKKTAALHSESPLFESNKMNSKAMRMLAMGKESAAQKLESVRRTGQPEEIAAWEAAYGAARQTGWNKSTQQAGLTQLTQLGKEFSSGQAGYNELSQAVADIAGVSVDENGRLVEGKPGTQHANAGLYTNMMNDMQYNLGNAGRYDLGGINDAKGYDAELGFEKVSPYQILQSKPEAIEAAINHYRTQLQGASATDPLSKVQLNAAVRLRELQSGKAITTGKNAQKIDEGMARVKSDGIAAILGRKEVKQQARDFGRSANMERYDAGEPDVSSGDRTPGAAGRTGAARGSEQQPTSGLIDPTKPGAPRVTSADLPANEQSPQPGEQIGPDNK